MKLESALSYALGKPGAWSDNPWGEDHHVVKVGSKIFLFPGRLELANRNEPAATITVKNTAEAIEELRLRHPDLAAPAPYLNKRLWTRLIIDELEADEVRELIDDSYDLVVAKLPRSARPAG